MFDHLRAAPDGDYTARGVGTAGDEPIGRK